jgi:hypothetical protein
MLFDETTCIITQYCAIDCYTDVKQRIITIGLDVERGVKLMYNFQ